MRRKPRRNTMADTMLKTLEKRYPGGASTAEIAVLLYGKSDLEYRMKVGRVARTLRKWGFRVYGFGGIYSLCNNDPEKLRLVFNRTVKSAYGWILSADEVTHGIETAGDGKKALEAREELKKALLDLAASI